MCVARDVGAKTIQALNLIIVPAKAHMAKPCDAAAKMLNIFQSSFRWRLICAARDVGAKMAQSANLIIIAALSLTTATCRHTFTPNREFVS